MQVFCANTAMGKVKTTDFETFMVVVGLQIELEKERRAKEKKEKKSFKNYNKKEV